MDQRLRLTAEVKNNASPALKQISKDLREVKATPALAAATTSLKNFGEVADNFVKSGAGISGVMTAVGVGGLTAAASLAGLVSQLRDLGAHTADMRRLGRETGLTLDQVNRWEMVGQTFRVPVEKMEGALAHLGDAFVDFNQRRGDLFAQLSQQDPDFVAKLQLEDTQHRLQDILGWLSKIPDTAKQNRWAQEFFGTSDLTKMLDQGLPKLQQALRDANKNVAPISPEFMAQSDKLAKSVVDLNQSWENFELKTGPAFLGMLSAIVDKSAKFFRSDEQIADDRRKQHDAGAADERKRFDDEFGPDSPSTKALKKWREQGSPTSTSPSNSNGNALHSNDEAPAGKGWFDNLFHRSAFTTGLGGSDDGMSGQVKDGVLAALREWAASTDTTTAKGGAGLVKASLETWDGATGGGGASGPSLSLKGFGGKGTRGSWWTPEHQQHAVDRLMREGGLSEAGAEGLVSRWANVESRGGPGSVNPNSGAAGIGQWLGSRKHGFTADFDDQLGHAIQEGKTSELRAWRALQQARNPREGAIGASRYERAEGYNGSTGIDNFTGQTLAGMKRVHDEVEAARRSLPSLTDEARKAATPAPGSSDGSIEAHVHIHDGQVRGATARSSGIVKQPRINLKRGPTMTEASMAI